jgi:hypothetical protein
LLARIFAAGILSFTALAAFGPGTATAAGASSWTGYANQARLQFRPWQARTERRVSDQRWRPLHRSVPPAQPAPRYQPAPRQQPALIASEPRYSAPVSRAFARSVNVGVRFRPNSRAAVAAADRVQTTPQAILTDPVLQSQFRPSAQKRRQTYEELQAKRPSPGSWNPYTRMARYDLPKPTRDSGSADASSYSPYWRSW